MAHHLVRRVTRCRRRRARRQRHAGFGCDRNGRWYPRIGQRVADVLGDRTPCTVISALSDPAGNCSDRRRARVIRHGCRLGHRIRVDVVDSRSATEHGLDSGLLRSPLHALDFQHCRLEPEGAGIGCSRHRAKYAAGRRSLRHGVASRSRPVRTGGVWGCALSCRSVTSATPRRADFGTRSRERCWRASGNKRCCSCR